MDHPDTSGAFGADSFLSIADAAYKQSEIFFLPVRHYGTRPVLSSNFLQRTEYSVGYWNIEARI